MNLFIGVRTVKVDPMSCGLRLLATTHLGLMHDGFTSFDAWSLPTVKSATPGACVKVCEVRHLAHASSINLRRDI